MHGQTLLLSLDFQNGIFSFVPGAEAIVPNAVKAVATARKNGVPVMHVGLGFEPGYPEIAGTNSRFSQIKDRGAFLKGSEEAKVHASIFSERDTVVYKHRVSAFSGNALGMILQAQKFEHLILFGIATSGIVLSTLRQASDLDFRCTVVHDACFDADAEVHRVLTEKIFPKQAEVIASSALERILTR